MNAIPQPIFQAVVGMLAPYGVTEEMLTTALESASVGIPELITRDEAAKIFGVNPITIDRWAAEGKIQKIKISRKLSKITMASLKNLIEQSSSQVSQMPFGGGK